MLKQKRSIAKPAPIDSDFQRDRLGHNGKGADLHLSRITYLASAKGYVMARRPGCTPFAIPEALWRSFPYWTAAPASAGKPAGYPETVAGDKAGVNP